MSLSVRPSLWLIPTLVFIVVGGTGCAALQGGSSRSEGDTQNQLVFSELDASLSGKTAYEVVEEYRPQWLQGRGRTSIKNPEEVNVYLEGTEYGPVDSLKEFGAENVESVEYLSSGEAQFRFGPGNPQGAIVVYLRSQ